MMLGDARATKKTTQRKQCDQCTSGMKNVSLCSLCNFECCERVLRKVQIHETDCFHQLSGERLVTLLYQPNFDFRPTIDSRAATLTASEASSSFSSGSLTLLLRPPSRASVIPVTRCCTSSTVASREAACGEDSACCSCALTCHAMRPASQGRMLLTLTCARKSTNDSKTCDSPPSKSTISCSSPNSLLMTHSAHR